MEPSDFSGSQRRSQQKSATGQSKGNIERFFGGRVNESTQVAARLSEEKKVQERQKEQLTKLRANKRMSIRHTLEPQAFRDARKSSVQPMLLMDVRLD